MPRFSANVSMLFTEVPFLERFVAAANAGFPGVECQFPYLHEANEVADKVAMSGAEIVVINAPPGDWAAGERGIAALPGREQEFKDALEVALNYADIIECPRLHCMAGCITEDKRTKATDTYLANIAYAADQVQQAGLTLLIEPISLPGYFVGCPDHAVELLRQLDRRNIKILYDVHHAQRTQGNIAEFLEKHLDLIGHVQVSGVPGRNEPDKLGEINWPYLFDMLDSHGYDGWIGAEYNPRASTLAGLVWGADWGIGEGAKSKECT